MRFSKAVVKWRVPIVIIAILLMIPATIGTVSYTHLVTGIWLSWPIGWCIAAALSIVFYSTEKWSRFSANR